MQEAFNGEELWNLTLEHSPVGMALVGLDGRWLVANRAVCDMLGYDIEELNRRGFQELTHPDDLDADLELFHRTLAGEIDSYRISKRYLRADGHVVWGDLSVAAVPGPDGLPLYFISQILDITEQQEYQQRLQAANDELEHERQSLEAIFETTNVGLLLIGADGRYRRMNRRHQELLDGAFPDGHAGVAGQLGHVYLPDGVTLMSTEQMPSYRATQGEEFDDYTYWAGADQAHLLAFSVSARQVRGPNGERLGAALAYQEITDLMRALKVRDDFVSSVSHELRTPLTSVLGHLELLADDGSLSLGVREQIRVVQRNAVRLRGLVSDLLQVAQADAGNVQLQLAEVDLAAVVHDAVEAGRPAAQRAQVTVTVDVPDELVVTVDEQRIRQVVDNLLSNAVKYTGASGTAHVAARLVSSGVELTVSDTGIGIAPDDVARVFTRFFRSREALDRHLPGFGLGLNIVHSIVAAHDGTVSLESEVGRGSTFRVAIPCAAL